MSKIEQIKCAKCGKEYEIDNVPPNDGCGGRIDFTFDLEKLKEKFSQESLETDNKRSTIQKYFNLLPLTDRKAAVTLGEGQTALLRSKRLADKMGIENLFLKIETTNPSGSFKDRPISVGVSRALEEGAK
ncbi:MAG: pyridoxal-phosphate dependent enzyme, partial [Candidatus Thorarchaeota archaeon]